MLPFHQPHSTSTPGERARCCSSSGSAPASASMSSGASVSPSGPHGQMQTHGHGHGHGHGIAMGTPGSRRTPNRQGSSYFSSAAPPPPPPQQQRVWPAVPPNAQTGTNRQCSDDSTPPSVSASATPSPSPCLSLSPSGQSDAEVLWPSPGFVAASLGRGKVQSNLQNTEMSEGRCAEGGGRRMRPRRASLDSTLPPLVSRGQEQSRAPARGHTQVQVQCEGDGRKEE